MTPPEQPLPSAGEPPPELLRKLRERMKELRGLHDCAAILRREGREESLLLRDLAEVIVAAMQYPSLAGCRLRIGGLAVTSGDFDESGPGLSGAFRCAEGMEGRLEIRYSGEIQTMEEPFLSEEKEFLETLVEMLRSHFESRQARKALERTENLYRQLFEQNPQPPFVLHKRDGLLLEVNRVAAQTLGVPKSNLVGRKFSEIFEEQNPGSYQRGGREDADASRLASTKIGKTLHCELVRQSIPFGSEDAELVIAVDRTREEEDRGKLVSSNLRFRQLADSMPLIVWTALPDGRVNYSSREFFSFTGASREEDPVSRWQRHLHPEDLQRCMDAWKRSIESGTPFDIEYRIRRASDGEYRWFQVQAVLVEDEEGRPYQWFGSAVDIHETKTLQARALELAADLQGIFDSSLDVICTLDKDACFLKASAAATEVWGIEAAKLTGKSLFDLVVEEERSRTRSELESIRREERAGVFEIRGKGDLDESVLLQWSVIWSEADQKFFCVARDITEHKRIEEQFLRAQRMESIGTLAAGIAHDFNNLLAPIMVSSGLLREMDQEGNFRKLADTIEKNAARGAALVKRVLSFAKGQEGAMVPVAPAHLLREIEFLVRNTFPKNIRLDLDCEREVPLVHGDPTQIHQVLLNLCINSKDAMPDGGRLAISIRKANVGEEMAARFPRGSAGDFVLFRIEDTGSGMPPDVLSHIFEPFFTTKEQGAGTGLGLTTALKIVESHRGLMDVRSAPGKGTVFEFYLPTRTEALSSVDEKIEPLDCKPGRGELVLVVDDETAIIETICSALENANYRAMGCSDGVQAISVFSKRSEETAVVVVDWMMPLMDGEALIEALQTIDPEVRIVAMSGMDITKLPKGSGHRQIREFLPKPFSMPQLLETVRRTIDNR